MPVMHIREQRVIRRIQLGEIQTAWLISITWLNLQFLSRAWELVPSDAELQFDLNILRARLIPADFNLRNTTPHNAWQIGGSDLGKVESTQTEMVIRHVSSNNRRGLHYPDDLIFRVWIQKSRKCVGCDELERCSWPVSNVLENGI